MILSELQWKKKGSENKETEKLKKEVKDELRIEWKTKQGDMKTCEKAFKYLLPPYIYLILTVCMVYVNMFNAQCRYAYVFQGVFISWEPLKIGRTSATDLLYDLRILLIVY